MVLRHAVRIAGIQLGSWGRFVLERWDARTIKSHTVVVVESLAVPANLQSFSPDTGQLLATLVEHQRNER